MQHVHLPITDFYTSDGLFWMYVYSIVYYSEYRPVYKHHFRSKTGAVQLIRIVEEDPIIYYLM